MNGAHLHLILNHVPVVGVPIALFAILYARWSKNDRMLRAAYGFLIGVALITLPVFWTGEPAEHVVEHVAGVSEALIESHEEAAEFALVVTMMSAGFALVGFFASRLEARLPNYRAVLRFVPVLTLIVLTVNTGALGYAANLGGMIRHSEIRATGTLGAAGTAQGEEAGEGGGEEAGEKDDD